MGTLFNADLKSKRLKGLYKELELQYKYETEHPLIKKYFLDQIKDEIEEEKEYLREEREDNCIEHIFIAPTSKRKQNLTEFTCVKCGKKIRLSEQDLYLKNFRQSLLSSDFFRGFDLEIGRLLLNKNEISDKDIEYYRLIYLNIREYQDSYPWMIEELILKNYEQDKNENLQLKYKKRD